MTANKLSTAEKIDWLYQNKCNWKMETFWDGSYDFWCVEASTGYFTQPHNTPDFAAGVDWVYRTWKAQIKSGR